MITLSAIGRLRPGLNPTDGLPGQLAKDAEDVGAIDPAVVIYDDAEVGARMQFSLPYENFVTALTDVWASTVDVQSTLIEVEDE